LYQGKVFENILLKFKEGRIHEATSSNTKAMNAILDTDEGARYVGEFAIGLNPFVNKPMLDTFHMNIEEVSLVEAISRAGRDLAHFHLCESNGSILGSGHLDLAAVFAALDEIEYRGFVSVKVYRHPWKVGAETSIRYLYHLLEGQGT
jgi:hypothetical protein